MQTTSGVALVAAAVLLLIASGRACRRGAASWLISDTFVLAVVGPGLILSLTIGLGMMYFASVHGESVPFAILGMVFAAGITGLAALEWLHSRRPEVPAASSTNVLEFTGKQSAPSGPSTPDAPRPPVAPHTRRAA